MAASDRSVKRFLQQVDKANSELGTRWAQVRGHLKYGLGFPVSTSSILYRRYVPPHDFLGDDGRNHRKPVRALYGLGQSANSRYERDVSLYNAQSAALRDRVERENRTVDSWTQKARAGDRDAVSWYCKSMLSVVLPAIPGGLATYLVTGYSSTEKHLVVERYVPGLTIIPEVDHYEVGRTLSLQTARVSEHDRKAWFLQLLAQVGLLTLDRIFRWEIYPAMDVGSVNLLTVMQNPATGHEDVVYLLSLTAERSRLWSLNLQGVDAFTCATELGARITQRPGEYSPIEPWVESDHGDVVVTVSGIPLLKMDPAQFERVVTDLLRRMGLRAETTGQTGDGGVDCIAFDDRPVIGGKVIVQVKRYTNTVPPTVVRDLFGTVHATGAMKGVLVTTSGFGPESRQFAEGKPLELIDGVRLDALLRQYDLGSALPSAPLEEGDALRSDVLRISPDGKYYWNGSVWQAIEAADLQGLPS